MAARSAPNLASTEHTVTTLTPCGKKAGKHTENDQENQVPLVKCHGNEPKHGRVGKIAKHNKSTQEALVCKLELG